MVVLFVSCLGVEFLCYEHLMCVFKMFSKDLVAEWPHIGKMAVHSAYNIFLRIST